MSGRLPFKFIVSERYLGSITDIPADGDTIDSNFMDCFNLFFSASAS